MPWKALFMPARHMSRDMFTCEYFDCNDAFGHGAFQKRLMMLCALSAFLANIHALAFPLISKSVQYRCKQPYANDSKAFGKNGAARDDSRQIGECLVYEDPADPNDTQTVPCVEWEYDEDRAKSTAVSTWNMVCGRKPLIVVMYAIQNTGPAVFVLTAGYFADNYGRVPVLLTAIAVLTISTVAVCVFRDYAVHAVFKFFSSGSSILTMTSSAISLFEVTTHDNRPLSIAVSITIGLLVADSWFFLLVPWSLCWERKLSVFLLPALVLLPTFLLVHESPRWLIATGRFNRAEEVVIAAADKNHFPLANAACLIDSLKEDTTNRLNRRKSTCAEELLSLFSMRRRALVLCGCFFSNSFALYAITFSKGQLYTPWLPFIAFFFNSSVYGLAHWLMRRFAMLTVITILFAALCSVQCFLCLTVFGEYDVATEALLQADIALYYSGAVVCFVYVLELFPTALRATAVGWTVACGRLGVGCALFLSMLINSGLEYVPPAVAGLLLFLSLLTLRILPPATTIECTKIACQETTYRDTQNIELMKATLDTRLSERKKAKTPSESTNRSTTSRSRRFKGKE
ncbi:solute carrier family 22 member 7-like [Rhipicephalus microplus]|uniref:solute carrier family 22 member 7-like n=1 Tax=Rhipicephalus microplus TaxID=6941 RepID=UPI003F6D0056